MNSIIKKYPKWAVQDPDIWKLIEKEIYIYNKFIRDMTMSSERTDEAYRGMMRLTKEIKQLIKQKEHEQSNIK